MAAALCLLLSAAVLYFVIRYRVHIHVEYSGPRRKHTAGRTAHGKVTPRPLQFESGTPPNPLNLGSTARRQDLVSALKHLGCTQAAASKAATVAMSHQDEQFEVALRRAISYAHQEAA